MLCFEPGIKCRNAAQSEYKKEIAKHTQLNRELHASETCDNEAKTVGEKERQVLVVPSHEQSCFNI